MGESLFDADNLRVLVGPEEIASNLAWLKHLAPAAVTLLDDSVIHGRILLDGGEVRLASKRLAFPLRIGSLLNGGAAYDHIRSLTTVLVDPSDIFNQTPEA